MKLFTLMRLGLWSSVFVGGVIVLAGGSQQVRSLFNRFSPSQPEVDVRSVILKSVQSSSELTTSIFVMEVAVPTEQNIEIKGFVIGTTKLLYLAHGEVRAGVDLSAIKKEDFTVEGEKLVLHLPAPKLLDSKIDVTQSKVYDYSKGWLGPDTAPQLQELAQRTALKRVEESACKGGILTRAGDQAKVAVQQLVQASGQAVEVEGKPGKC